ncbi:hypothetical protein PC123_g25685, partial [Phytophthora cactorum]
MPRWSSMLLPTLALAPSQVHSSNANQMDFAACLIQHSPEYLCCECTETTKVLYTKYNRPSGGDYESYYIDAQSAEFVYMLKRDETEVLLADRSGVSDFVAKVESFFASKGKISG